ncbi:hypothetical protein ACQEVC_42490 [Plantactinospora sp. CA-294935]|uniref:hypothetical protein n=1 Tax=Plantactinospora sp. CA-294935 TaxID=3240012 RepID=UPI003D903B0D
MRKVLVYLASAEALFRQAADRGYTTALRDVARMREQAGDLSGASCLRRFGLTDDGCSPATSPYELSS